MNLTNYEMLFCAGKVEKEIGEKFRKDWWDPVFREVDRRVFCEEAPKKFYAAARVMYVKWFKVWEAKGKPWGDCVDMDFGTWLCKGADPGLLVPAGRPVKHVSSDVFGITLEPDVSVLSGNYTLEHVRVDTANGVCHWQAEHVVPMNLPQSMLDFAKAQAMKDFKCPLLGKGGPDGV